MKIEILAFKFFKVINSRCATSDRRVISLCSTELVPFLVEACDEQGEMLVQDEISQLLLHCLPHRKQQQNLPSVNDSHFTISSAYSK